jgi:hypothetical protein
MPSLIAVKLTLRRRGIDVRNEGKRHETSHFNPFMSQAFRPELMFLIALNAVLGIEEPSSVLRLSPAELYEWWRSDPNLLHIRCSFLNTEHSLITIVSEIGSRG